MQLIVLLVIMAMESKFEQHLSYTHFRQVVLENSYEHLTRLSAEGLSLFRALLSPRQEVVLGACQEVGPGKPGSAAVPSVRPSAW